MLIEISTHALREEGDSCFLPLTITYTQFLSTPSARRATKISQSATCCSMISIHALREEGDLPAANLSAVSVSISIHALREEGDHVLAAFVKPFGLFLSTPSARRATIGDEGDEYIIVAFLSTPSARRATTFPHDNAADCRHFYPRPPRGGRLT